MKSKKRLLKTSAGITSTIALVGVTNTIISSCSEEPTVVNNYSIDPTSYSGYGEFTWTATKLVDGVSETKTGTHTLNSTNDNKTSLQVEFDNSDIHTYAVQWIYAESDVEYYINPLIYSSYENKVEWTATKNPPGEDNNLTETGTEYLTSNITSKTITFEDGTSHTFNVDWKYTDIEPLTQYSINPPTYSSYENKVEWVATKNPPGEDNNIERSGTYTLQPSDNPKTTLEVNFGTDENPIWYEFNADHNNAINWQYTDVDTLTEYTITPTKYKSYLNKVEWIATKNPPGDNNIVARWDDEGQEPYILENDTDNTTTFDVTFSDGTTHTFENLEWEYDEPEVTYNIDPKNYSSIDNVVNWTATKKVEGVDEPITRNGTIELNSESDNITSYTVNFGTDESPDNYTFENLSWTYVAPTITYDITPDIYSNQDNTVNWTAYKYVNYSVNDIQTGTKTLTEDISSFNVTFTGDDHQTFSVAWTYVAPTITYDITPDIYSNQDNTVNWTAYKYSNGSIVDTQTGTETLTEDISSFDVTFTGNDVQTFSVTWTYVAPTITYGITPTTYLNSDNTVSWSANKYENGSIVDTKSGTQTLIEDVTSFNVTFNGNDIHTFSVKWLYQPTVTSDYLKVDVNGLQTNVTNSATSLIINNVNPKIKQLWFGDTTNVHNYESVIISGNSNLELIKGLNNMSKISDMDISFNSSLTILDEQLNLPNLSWVIIEECNLTGAIHFEGCNNLTDLYLDANPNLNEIFLQTTKGTILGGILTISLTGTAGGIIHKASNVNVNVIGGDGWTVVNY